MPFLRLTIQPAPTKDSARELAVALTGLMAEALSKKAELTSVLVEGASGTWTIGGAEQDRACHLEATITAGTNTSAQKVAFIAAAMRVLKDRLGPLHPASYVTLREVAATDWGYDGSTQAARR